MRVNTQRELAEALGKSLAVIGRQIRTKRWPFGTKGPWEVNAVNAWLLAMAVPALPLAAPPPRPPAIGIEGRAKMKVGLERGKMLQLQREKMESEYYQLEFIQRFDAFRAALVRKFVGKPAPSLCATILAIPVREASEAVEKEARRILDAIQKADTLEAFKEWQRRTYGTQEIYGGDGRVDRGGAQGVGPIDTDAREPAEPREGRS